MERKFGSGKEKNFWLWKNDVFEGGIKRKDYD